MPKDKGLISVRSLLFFLFSVAVSVGIFSYLFQFVSFKDVKSLLLNANRNGMLAFVIITLSMSGFRTWRYYLVLKVSGFRPEKIALFLTTLVRNFFSDLLPARLGTLIYIYIVNTRLGIPFGAAASSFALPFLFDIIALVPLIFLAVLFIGANDLCSTPGMITAGLFLLLISILLLYFLPSLGRFAARLTHRFSSLSEALTNAAKEMEVAKKARIYWKLLGLSLLVRITKYSAMYFLMFALLAPEGKTLQDLAPQKVFIGLLLPEFAASTPFAGIGGFGAYEGTCTFALKEILNFSADLAAATSIAHHLITQIFGWSLGAIAALILLLPFYKKDQLQPD